MRTISYLITLLFLLTFSFSSHAALKTVEFTATVNYVDDYGNALGGSVKPGDQITGTYTIDSDMIDNDPSPEFANYYNPPPLLPGLGFNLNLPNLSYVPTNGSTDLNLYIYDGTNFDHYTVMTCCSAGSLSNGATVEHVLLDLVDESGNTLTSADVNTDLAVLNALPKKILFIDGYGGNGARFHIEASVFKLAIPGGICEAPVTANKLSFNATIVDIYNSGTGPLGVNVGDQISGNYTFDPDVQDSDPAPEYAYYPYPHGNPFGNIELSIAGTTLTGNANLHEFSVFVANHAAGIGSDHFSVSSWSENMPLPAGGVIDGVSIDFYDPNGSALSSTSIPDSIPTSVSGWMYHDVYINGTSADGTFFSITAKVDTINTDLIPPLPVPPSPLTISPASGTFISRQFFSTAILLEPNMPDIVNHTVILSTNGVDNPVFCERAALTLNNRQYLYCGTMPRGLLEEGVNTLKVEIELIDQSVHTQEVIWELLPR